MRDFSQHNRIQRFHVAGLAQVAMVLLLGFTPLAYADTSDQSTRFVFERDNRTIVLETFGANILRVTLSSEKSSVFASPGYGIVGTPCMAGWTHEQDSAGYDVVRSARMLVRVAPKNLPAPQAMPLDELNQSLRNRYFYGDWGRGTYNDEILIANTAGKPLLKLHRWAMVPNASSNKAGTQASDAG